MKTGVAIDLGTSGFRAQKIDLEKGEIKKTVITLRNPLPGANVMDHLDFAIHYGLDKAHGLSATAVKNIIAELGVKPEEMEKFSICGNPIQLSIFQGIPIEDLAYAGERKKQKYHIEEQNRDARVIPLTEIEGFEEFKNCKLFVPPSIKHEVGADALALIVKAGMIESDEIAIATDYGTNAEMALKSKGIIYTGSAAAGPALEGQEIEYGSIASPHTISDVEFEGENLRCYVLDRDMNPAMGDLVNPKTGDVVEKGEVTAKGITGTGVIALIETGIRNKLIVLPKIKTPEGIIHLQDGIKFTEKDLTAAGRAIGALRAGHITLCVAAGIEMEDLKIAHMSGAAGTYMDAEKAHQVGMIPFNANYVSQIGNTSLAVAREILLSEDRLWELQAIAKEIVGTHVMFATSEAFKEAYMLELAYWNEGMAFKMLQKFLKKKSLPRIGEPSTNLKIDRQVERDIPVLGEEGLEVLEKVGTYLTMVIEDCTDCKTCAKVCPTGALRVEDGGTIKIRTDLCDGANCQRCLHACPDDRFKWENLTVAGN
ncbi:MAG: methylamine methyltransferase corrinoid protein reductive activase [Methanosarcina sp.]|uniref:methylamine methyltransferase corrinoid protein reductive activase n=1 Tax=Methanosarcina sp. TaxID=2213 RepID=UPI002617608E|nr:methylamine methyltransferase corrinoid protein reductive activase [Methanosarcina sp.]MDD3245288.1 methylamine methyltransferase corrinoid protein reductive activase [Methanosarcina sp.]MDD4249695.1 methylamine methyltransferase corrinoid protein reductive activase [Methanosarcina sp.]